MSIKALFDQIYSDDFTYSMKRELVEGYIAGRGFPESTLYNEEEVGRVEKEIVRLAEKVLFGLSEENERVAILTVGGPGAGKTTLEEADLAKTLSQGKKFGYIDPDAVCLKGMVDTYLADIEKGDKSFEARKAAYDKWRPASNAAAQIILALLIKHHFSFYFGTTGTSPATYLLLKFLKEHGYKIKLLHLSAPDDVRWGSIQAREFVQTTESDVREKGKMLFERISDTYLKYADEIEFYNRNQVKEDAILAARWIRIGENRGALEIINQAEYDKVVALHNAGVKALNKELLSWENTVIKSLRE